jgi:geranylgeranyl pyrophosphate synthase
LAAWYARRADAVLSEAAALVQRQAQTPEQAALLDTAFAGLRAIVTGGARYFPAIHLPLLVHHAVRGDDTPALPLAVATTCWFVGCDVLDDLADGDLPAAWRGYRPAEIQLAALTFLCALPALALAALDAPAARRAPLLDTIAQGGLRMAAGQQQDLRLTGSTTPDAAAAEAALARSGEEIGLFSRLAAQLADVAPATVEAYTRFGRALGAVWQLRNDWDDLFGPAPSKDLANGTRTLPIVLGLVHRRGAAREEYLALLERAREDPTARAAVCEAITHSGAAWHVVWLGQVYGHRARRALAEAAPRGPAGAILEQLIDDGLLGSPGSDGAAATTESAAAPAQ